MDSLKIVEIFSQILTSRFAVSRQHIIVVQSNDNKGTIKGEMKLFPASKIVDLKTVPTPFPWYTGRALSMTVSQYDNGPDIAYEVKF